MAKRMEERKLKLPLLIGGATTSKMHTAVKLVTQYSGPVVHVLDASRSVPVAQTLLDKNRTAGFVEDVREVPPLTISDLIKTALHVSTASVVLVERNSVATATGCDH